MRKRLVYSLLALIFSACAQAQTPAVFTPANSDTVALAAVQQKIHAQYLADSTAITGENKKYHRLFLKDRFESIDSKFKEKEFLQVAEIN